MDGLESGSSLPQESGQETVVDLSTDFLKAIKERWPIDPNQEVNDQAINVDFDDRLRENRHAKKLSISVDWSSFPSDTEAKRNLMRYLKALKEKSSVAKERGIKIRGTIAEKDEAAKIESNVLASGVLWEFTAEPQNETESN